MSAVWYPAAWSSFGNVSWLPSKGIALVMAPFTWLWVPVRIVARLGTQMEFPTNAFRNSIPSRASPSMFGVGVTSAR